MRDLLFLVHRIPYPPNKGDKIRSFHMLEALARRYRVHLGTFVDDRRDRRYVAEVGTRCASCFAPNLWPRSRRVASLRGILSGDPLTNVYYAHRALRKWAAHTVRKHAIDRVVVFSSSMAQFVPTQPATPLRRVIDFCDIDSDKWRQYAESRRGPLAWIYGRESRLLADTEGSIAREFDASVFVSEQEAAAFRAMVPDASGKVSVVRNGVDAQALGGGSSGPRPAQLPGAYVAFTGAMDYWANVEGVTWFAEHVWPMVRAARPDVSFAIVGARPTAAVRRLASMPGIIVTGSVPEIGPWLTHAHVAVAPLRIARGVQNKVLEAMAMGRVVVATPAAVRGLDVAPPEDVLVAEEAEDFARRTLAALEPSAPYASSLNREYVADHYDWDRNLDVLLDLVEDAPAAPAASVALAQ